MGSGSIKRQTVKITGRRMEEETMAKLKGGPQYRRRSLTGTGLVALVLAVAAGAWACTLQVGTLKVCSPVPIGDVAGGKCASKTGNGSQVGGTASSKGSAMSITASNMNATNYSILFSNPAAVLGGSNCHLASASGVTSVIGYNSGQPKTIAGPNFSVGTHVSTVTGGPGVFIPSNSGTGTAKLCVQDEPNRVTGNQILMTII